MKEGSISLPTIASALSVMMPYHLLQEFSHVWGSTKLRVESQLSQVFTISSEFFLTGSWIQKSGVKNSIPKILYLPKCVCSIRCGAIGLSVYQIKNPRTFLAKQVVNNIFYQESRFREYTSIM
jgi:hypothetical protein